MVLGLKQLPDTGEAQEFLCAQHGVGRPRFILFFLLVLHFDLRFWRSEELRTFQVVKIGTNLLRGEQSPDGATNAGSSAANSESCSAAITKLNNFSPIR
jgi:hypothetical protein